MHIEFGERIATGAVIKIGCSAVIFDASREKVLLTQREDNQMWCLPSGGMEPGESAGEACIREVWEETGLHVALIRLVGVYSTPHEVVIRDDGSRYQLVAICFEAEITGGTLGLSDETLDYGYFTRAEMAELAVLPNQVRRIHDAWRNLPQPVIE
jgi:8-oxo-dGTP pyrophosphatase MutT (NUDIX family)